MYEIKMKRHREKFVSSVTTQERIFQISIEHEEREKVGLVNDLVIEWNLMEVLQPNNQELTGDIECIYTNEIIEIVKNIMDKVVIPVDLVEFSSDGYLIH